MPVKFTYSSWQMKTWLLIHQCHSLLQRAENSIMAEIGLTIQQHSILFALDHLKRPVKVVDVAHWLDRNPNTISMLIDRMVKDGLIKRERDLPDRRTVRVSLTEKGKKLLFLAEEKFWSTIPGFFEDFTEDQLKIVVEVLTKVRIKALQRFNIEVNLEQMEIVQDPLSNSL